MNRKIARPVAVVLVLTAAAGYAWWHHRPAETAPTRLYGNVDIREVELAFRQGGRIARLAVDEGRSVRQGEQVAELDAQPYRDGLKAAQAQRAQALAELAKLRQGSRWQEVAQAQQAVYQAEALASQADRERQRQSVLQAQGATTERAVEAAQSARDQSLAALVAARQVLSLRREGSRREDIQAAEAKLASAEAQLAQAETAFADARLLAPSDGVISARVREAGSMVTAGATVYTLSLQDPVYVRAYVSQTQLTQFQPGSAVVVSVDGSQKRFQGTVGFISPKAEFTPKSVETAELRTELVYRLRIAVPGAAQVLRQGMPVTVELGTPSAL
ncbi:secretion protein HlyD [Pelomonas sp. Root1217]|uniref:secretion protein HlyD n=1 Tax=Pelomonas sp. Root1217 TaxID=1736430 RepID=UPI00070F7468|nr:secretion protein HlyD [Pelomonas sp. Root1217]KQV49496.1 secretion protein HlyD [Pelomonas sp. Root1217]